MRTTHMVVSISFKDHNLNVDLIKKKKKKSTKKSRIMFDQIIGHHGSTMANYCIVSKD